MMFDYLIESNGLLAEVTKYSLTPTDLKFVKEQIAGPLESEMSSQANSDWPYEGRPKEKSFLYEVSVMLLVYIPSRNVSGIQMSICVNGLYSSYRLWPTRGMELMLINGTTLLETVTVWGFQQTLTYVGLCSLLEL